MYPREINFYVSKRSLMGRHSRVTTFYAVKHSQLSTRSSFRVSFCFFFLSAFARAHSSSRFLWLCVFSTSRVRVFSFFFLFFSIFVPICFSPVRDSLIWQRASSFYLRSFRPLAREFAVSHRSRKPPSHTIFHPLSLSEHVLITSA